LTIHELEEEAGISQTTCHEIHTKNLGMHHVDVSKDLVNRANTDENRTSSHLMKLGFKAVKSKQLPLFAVGLKTAAIPIKARQVWYNGH
jgi:hypothetical protein